MLKEEEWVNRGMGEDVLLMKSTLVFIDSEKHTKR